MQKKTFYYTFHAMNSFNFATLGFLIGVRLFFPDVYPLLLNIFLTWTILFTAVLFWMSQTSKVTFTEDSIIHTFVSEEIILHKDIQHIDITDFTTSANGEKRKGYFPVLRIMSNGDQKEIPLMFSKRKRKEAFEIIHQIMKVVEENKKSHL